MNISKTLLFFFVFGIFTEKYIELSVITLMYIILTIRKSSYLFNKKIILICIFIFMYSAISILLLNYNIAKSFQQFFLLFVSINLYWYILNQISLDIVFKTYLRLAVVISVLGLLQFTIYLLIRINIFSFLYNKTPVISNNVLRVTSIIDEPSYLSTLITPALVYYMKNFQKNFYKLLILLITLLLTFSTVSYIVFFFIVLYLFIKKYKKVGFLLSICVIVFFLLSTIELDTDNSKKESSIFSDVIIKVTDTIEALSFLEPKMFEKMNLSTYALLTNYWVSKNAPNRLLGTGLGTHEQSYTKLYKSNYIAYGLNKSDAYSLGIRITSEFGYIGIFIFIVFLITNFNNKCIINQCSFFYLLTMCIRGGHYTRYGLIFFLCIFIITKKHRKNNFRKLFLSL